MRGILIVRNACAVMFLMAAIGTVEPEAAERRICMVGLTWQLNGCQTSEACLIESHEMASSGPVGDGCPVTCAVGCAEWQNESGAKTDVSSSMKMTGTPRVRSNAIAIRSRNKCRRKRARCVNILQPHVRMNYRGSQNAGGAVVGGIVQDGVTQRPIAGATVTARAPGLTLNVRTGADGGFVISLPTAVSGLRIEARYAWIPYRVSRSARSQRLPRLASGRK